MSNFNESTDYQRGEHSELIERVNQNLIDYHDMLDGFSKRELIEMAGKIAAMRDAHEYITTFKHFDNEGLDFLMQFQSPLNASKNKIQTISHKSNYCTDKWKLSLDFI